MVGTAPPKRGSPQNPKTFAEGTALFPVPIPSASLNVNAPAVSTPTMLTPVPKSGFIARLRFNISGTITVGTLGTAYTVPLWRLIQNYTLQNSLSYPYRSLDGDSIREWMRICGPQGTFDPITNSSTFQNPVVTAAATVNYAFGFTDNIGQNDGVNFSRYLLSALNTSNDLTVVITWIPIGSLSRLQANTVVFTSYTANVQVSASYYTVPNANPANGDVYAWPKRNIVQQVVNDPSFSAVTVGENDVNITPISGPEFTGLGFQVVAAAGALDPLTPNGGFVSEIDIYVNGTIPLYQFKIADLIERYENLFGRSPANGYIYLDFMSDLSLPNVMSHVHRKVLSTSKYTQITAKIFTTANYTTGVGAFINVFKRTQQKYANNK